MSQKPPHVLEFVQPAKPRAVGPKAAYAKRPAKKLTIAGSSLAGPSIADLQDSRLRTLGEAAGKQAFAAGVAVPVMIGDKLAYITASGARDKKRD
jgi:hypothetical protein